MHETRACLEAPDGSPPMAAEFRQRVCSTDAEGAPVELDATRGAHGRLEQPIWLMKDSEPWRFPFPIVEANPAWMTTVAMAADLLGWFQLLCPEGAWIAGRPEAMR